jgi:hypothetical protein
MELKDLENKPYYRTVNRKKDKMGNTQIKFGDQLICDK